MDEGVLGLDGRWRPLAALAFKRSSPPLNRSEELWCDDAVLNFGTPMRGRGGPIF